jgi:hypothetical protein
VGYYPDKKTATRIGRRLAWLLGVETKERIEVLVDCLTSGVTSEREARGHFTPADCLVLRDFSDWWMVDSVEDFRERIFFAVDLNLGKSVAIRSIRTVAVESLDWDETCQTMWTKWKTADEADVIALQDVQDRKVVYNQG